MFSSFVRKCSCFMGWGLENLIKIDCFITFLIFENINSNHYKKQFFKSITTET